MPHPDYREMNEEFARDPTFRSAYEYYPARSLGTRLALAMRRDGPHAAAIRPVLLRGPEPAARPAPDR